MDAPAFTAHAATATLENIVTGWWSETGRSLDGLRWLTIRRLLAADAGRWVSSDLYGRIRAGDYLRWCGADNFHESDWGHDPPTALQLFARVAAADLVLDPPAVIALAAELRLPPPSWLAGWAGPQLPTVREAIVAVLHQCGHPIHFPESWRGFCAEIRRRTGRDDLTARAIEGRTREILREMAGPAKSMRLSKG